MTLLLTNPVVDGDVTTYDATSTHNPQGTVFRILRPSTPAPGVAHRLLLVLPVKPGTSVEFGDGLVEIVADDLHNLYNLTCLAPTFPTEPWIGDHPTTANRRYESFLVTEVLPWASANLPAATETWLLSFSKGAYSAVTLFFRNPASFTGIGAWDCPAQVAWTTGEGWEMDEAYGSEANWIAEYQIASHANAWVAPFATLPATSYLSGDTSVYQAQTAWLRDQWLAEDYRFWFQGEIPRAHRWDTGWVPEALAALHTMAVARATDFPGQPAQVPGLIAPHPAAQGLALAILFHPQNGTVITNSGLAPGAGTVTTMNFLSTLDQDTIPTDLIQAPGASGILLGSAFTALDQVDKTLLVWCRPTALTTDQGLVSKDFDLGGGNDGGWGLILTAEGRLAFYVDAGHRQTDNGPMALVPDTEVMVAVTFQASTGLAQFYRDGVFTSAVLDATAVETPSGAARLNLGAIRDNDGMPFVGRLRQVRGYTRRLTDTEIADLAANPYLGFALFAADTSGTTGLLGFPPEAQVITAVLQGQSLVYARLP